MIDLMEASTAPQPTARITFPTAFRRVLFARNRLSLCEDAQELLFAPGGQFTAVLI
jgi:hypothetical protein